MTIPGFDSIEQIGDGAMTTVWRARQTSLDRLVALKILKAEFAADPEVVRSFLDEARTAARVKHPNIIHVHDVGEHQGTYYFVMEHIEGHTVASRLAQNGKFPQKQALDAALSVAYALEAVWEQARIVHLNLKPGNIIIGDDGTVKLADLGLARMVAPAHTQSRQGADTFLGTPNYVAPELVQGVGALDCRADMYSLGATLYHMLTGVMPFQGSPQSEAARQQVTGFLPHPRDLNPALSVAAAQLLARLMMKNPADRYPDWAAAAAAIRKAAAGKFVLGQRDRASSTVAPQQTAAEPAAAAKPRKAPLPAAVRATAWLILIACWSALAWTLLQRAPTPVSPDIDTPLPPVAIPKPPPPTPAPEPAPKPPPAQPPEALLKKLVRDIAPLLLREDFGQALLRLDEAARTATDATLRPQIAQLRASAAEIGRMYTIVEAQFRAKLGEPVALRIDQAFRQVVVGKADGGRIEGVMAKEGGTEKVSLAIRDLPPDDLIKWLGDSDTAEAHAMRCVLHAKAGAREKARESALKSGPFAEAFVEALQGTESAPGKARAP